jgi:hypothetical protein
MMRNHWVRSLAVLCGGVGLVAAATWATGWWRWLGVLLSWVVLSEAADGGRPDDQLPPWLWKKRP